MQMHELQTLQKRGVQYTDKRQLDALIRRKTSWSTREIIMVHRHRGDLLAVKHGLHRRSGDPSSSHEQFIQTSLLLDGFHDYRASCLAWSHDMDDDFKPFFQKIPIDEWYGRTSARDIRAMSRSRSWVRMPFSGEVQSSDKRIRSGGERCMVVKVLDRVHNDSYPLPITSEKRRRKSGMKLWQNFNSIYPMAQELGYMEKELLWLSNRQLKRLGFSGQELDSLVERPLNDP